MKKNQKRFALFAFAFSVSLTSFYASALVVRCGQIEGQDYCCLIWGPDVGGGIECKFL